MTKIPQVGDTLWLHFTIDRRDSLYTYTVTKIGHKWLTVARIGYPQLIDRVAISDFHIDGGVYSSPGTAYTSFEAYETTVAKKAAWEAFQKFARDNYRLPANLSLEEIRAAMTALKIP